MRSVVLAGLCVVGGACAAEEPEEVKQLTHAEAHAAAERAAGMAPGSLIEDHSYWWSEFMRCSGELSVITPPARQRRCYGLGAALITYFDGRRWQWDPDDLAGWEPLVIQRMEALGWLSEDEVAFRPITVR